MHFMIITDLNGHLPIRRGGGKKICKQISPLLNNVMRLDYFWSFGYTGK